MRTTLGAVLAAAMLMPAVAGAATKGIQFRASAQDIWRMTRRADVVAVATVETVGPQVVARVVRLVKGEVKGETVSFPRPPEPSPAETRVMRCPPPRVWRFSVGEQWLLFLKAAGDGQQFLEAVAGDSALTEQAAKDVLAFDALTDAREKAKLLVAFCVRPPPALMPSSSELQKVNTAANYDLLRPLGQVASRRLYYVDLLQANPHPDAEAELRALLGTESGVNLRRVVDALGRKSVESAELSEAIVPFIRHPDPVVRRTAVFILHRRDYRPVQTQVVQTLDDPDAVVRTFALAWPWNAYEKDHPEIRAKIKKMRGDPDAEVRRAAKLALASMSAWYRFWYLDR